MLSRVVAVVLVLALIGSVFATHEQTLSVLTSADSLLDAGPAAGSMADHHLDDLPAQAHAETAHDVAPLFAHHTRTAPPLPAAWPPTQRSTAPGAPWLAGLQRPPCAASVSAVSATHVA